MRKFVSFAYVLSLAFAFAACVGPQPAMTTLPDWAENGPGPSDIASVYPARAQEASIEGIAYLLCSLRPDRHLSCVIAREVPSGYGFGNAALIVAQKLVAKAGSDANVPAGKQIMVPIHFKISDE